jgi:hypothetical protein
VKKKWQKKRVCGENVKNWLKREGEKVKNSGKKNSSHCGVGLGNQYLGFIRQYLAAILRD